jgi:transposase
VAVEERMAQAALFTGDQILGNASNEGQHQRERRYDGKPRLVTADRSQLELRPYDLDGLIPQNHPARSIWAFVEKLDLSKFYEPIKARENEPGRSPTDPKVLLALWLYATVNGVGSARELDRLCQEHRAYEWLRGGVSMNYHTLSDFRCERGAALDNLLTQILAVLAKQGLIKLKRVAQDGTRVRASAGTASFRRRERLDSFLAQARQQVEAVKKSAADPELPARMKKARERATRQRQERLERALQELSKLEALRAAQTGGRKARGEARASTTDPEARRIKMGDGGFRPAYNVQFAADTESRFIVGVGITNIGSDQAEAIPMIDQVEERTGKRPDEYLVDGGFTGKDNVNDITAKGITIYGPVGERGDIDPHQPQPKDSPAIAQWRLRMATAEAKEIYKDRAATIERVNADTKAHRSLGRFLVRGMNKALSVALLNAITFNMVHWLSVGRNIP